MKSSILEKVYSPSEFELLGRRILKELSEHLSNTIQEKNDKTIEWNTPEKELQFWTDFLENGRKESFISEILNRTTHTHNPKYVGHQVAAPSPITALTSMVSSILNNGMAVYEMGMSPSAIERIVTDKVCQKIGYDANSGGFLTSGGTLANLTALLSARKAIVNHDVWNKGHNGQLGIMVCEEAHYCVDRAARIMGLGEQGIVKVPADENFSMNTNVLEKHFEEAKEKGIEIFAVIGSAPSTATGAYDDLQAIAQFAESNQIWFHVDGAHGGAAIYSDKYKTLIEGIEKADSVVIDGHKMMLMPTITTGILFKDKRHAQHTFSQQADYLLNDTAEDQWYQSGKKTFECTKTMMSLHWYVLLKFYGEEVFDEFVTRQYDLAQEFAQLLKNHPNFELAIWPQSNILCFRIVDESKSDLELNEINMTVRQQLLEDGEYYLVQTKLRGIHYLRTTLMNPFTTINHLELLMAKTLQIWKSIN